MNDMQLARMAVKIYPRTDYNSGTVKGLRRKWMASVRQLDRQWLLHPENRIQRHADKAVLIACVLSAFPWEWV